MAYRFGLKRVVPIGRLKWTEMKAKYNSTPVASCDYLSALPSDVGMMLNDSLGDCFEAACYHGDQVRTLFAHGAMQTQPDGDVRDLYSWAAGYVPGDANTDQGSDPAQVFAWIEKNGLPCGPNELNKYKRIIASFELDPSNMDDVLEAMDACGGLMVGFNVPSNITYTPGVWTFDPSATNIGGHEVLCGKLSPGSDIGLISWGSPGYAMAPDFWANYVNQCTAVVWRDWVESTGKTPLGMTVAQLEHEMAAIEHGTTS